MQNVQWIVAISYSLLNLEYCVTLEFILELINKYPETMASPSEDNVRKCQCKIEKWFL